MGKAVFPALFLFQPVSGSARIKRVIVNHGTYLAEVLEMYAEEKSEPVIVDCARLARLVPHVLIQHLSLENDTLTRHDPGRLCKRFSIQVPLEPCFLIDVPCESIIEIR
jgi:hypothetical protein